jgi:anti-sigma B factor antagonist
MLRNPGEAPVPILELDTDEHAGLVRIALRGELDLSTAPKVEEELQRVETRSPPIVALDLTRLSFLDSTGLRLVIRADARAREEGRRLAIIRGPDEVQRVFSITQLDERLEIVDDVGALQP